AKFLSFAPVSVMLLTVRATLPVLASVTVLGGLVVFTFCLLKVRLVGDRVAVAPTPVPDTPAVWGLLLALSVTVNVALREPVAAGVKVTLMVQVPLAAKVEGLRGQLLVCPKSPGLVPVKPMLVMVNARSEERRVGKECAARVMPTHWIQKDGTGEGERLGSNVPVPETPAVWGLLLALSVTVTVAVREKVVVGVKVMLMVQVPLAAKVEGLRGQLLVCPKSPGLVPVKPMLVMVNA